MGLMIASAAGAGVLATWYLLASFDLYPGRGLYQLVSDACLVVAITGPQYVVLRVVLGLGSGTAAAWVPTSLLIFAVEDFVAIFWFGDVVPFAVGLLFFGIIGLGQGLVLGEVLTFRPATPLWLLAWAAVVGVFFVLALLPGSSSPSNGVVDAILGSVVVGAFYGGVTGGFLVLIVRLAARARAQAPAAHSLPEPTL